MAMATMNLSRRALQRRSFVSTVLLSRTWDKHTMVELRKEAKARGLSTTGNKTTLIARLQEHDESAVTSTPASRIQSISQAASPGIPLPVQSDSASTNFLTVKLPHPSQPPRDARAQVPYVPDFWDSAASAPLETELPKVHVVGGSATLYNGGPSLEDPTILRADDPPPSQQVGFWADFWESMGLPRSFSARRSLSEAAAETESPTDSRPLTDGERKGLWVLLGIVGGSWLVGALVNGPTNAKAKTV